MKAYYKPFLYTLTIGTLIVLASCQNEEELNLVTYPDNKVSFSISDAKGETSVNLNAVYKSDGTLELNGPVSRTYTFYINPSPKDATVTYEVLSKNIPNEIVEISTKQAVIPAGVSEFSVMVGIKDDDFSFARTNFKEETYELGVKANIEGYKIPSETLEGKVSVHKEAYAASASILGGFGNNVTFGVVYTNGVIVGDPISYTFKIQLDKPVGEDMKIKFETTGVEKQFMSDVTITPLEVVIPAGQTLSEDVTWTITNDFLLQTANPESFIFNVKTLITCADPVFMDDESKSSLRITVNKVTDNLKYVENMPSNWIALDKSNWGIQLDPAADVWPNPKCLIDGIIDDGNYAYGKNFWIILDLKNATKITGVALDYDAGKATNVSVFISSDKETWLDLGTVETPSIEHHNVGLVAPMTGRYVKIQLSRTENKYVDLLELSLYTSN